MIHFDLNCFDAIVLVPLCPKKAMNLVQQAGQLCFSLLHIASTHVVPQNMVEQQKSLV